MKKKLSIAIGLGLFASTITLPIVLSSCKSSKVEDTVKEFNYKNIAFIAKVQNSRNYAKANNGQIIVDANENLNAINDLNNKIKSLSTNDFQSEMNQLWQHIYQIMLADFDASANISKNVENPIQLKSMNILQNGNIELVIDITYDVSDSSNTKTEVKEKTLKLTPKFSGKDELINQAKQFKVLEEKNNLGLEYNFNILKKLYLGNPTNSWNVENKYNSNFDYNDPNQKNQGLINYIVNFNNNVNSLARISGFEINLNDMLYDANDQINNFWIPSMTLSSIYFPTLDENNTNPSLDINSSSSDNNQDDNNKPEIDPNEVVNKLNPKFEKLNDVGFNYLTNVLNDTNNSSIDEKIDVLNNLTGIQIITDTVKSIEFDLNNVGTIKKANDSQNYILVKIEFNDKANKLANLIYEIKLYSQWFNSDPNYQGTSSSNTTNPNPDNKPNDEVKPPVSQPDNKPSNPDNNKPEPTPPSEPNLNNELTINSNKEVYVDGETITITASFKNEIDLTGSTLIWSQDDNEIKKINYKNKSDLILKKSNASFNDQGEYSLEIILKDGTKFVSQYISIIVNQYLINITPNTDTLLVKETLIVNSEFINFTEDDVLKYVWYRVVPGKSPRVIVNKNEKTLTQKMHLIDWDNNQIYLKVILKNEDVIISNYITINVKSQNSRPLNK